MAPIVCSRNCLWHRKAKVHHILTDTLRLIHGLQFFGLVNKIMENPHSFPYTILKILGNLGLGASGIGLGHQFKAFILISLHPATLTGYSLKGPFNSSRQVCLGLGADIRIGLGGFQDSFKNLDRLIRTGGHHTVGSTNQLIHILGGSLVSNHPAGFDFLEKIILSNIRLWKLLGFFRFCWNLSHGNQGLFTLSTQSYNSFTLLGLNIFLELLDGYFVIP